MSPARLCALLVALALACSGCWSRREIEQLAFALAAAVDREAESEDVRFTAQFANPGGGGGGGILGSSRGTGGGGGQGGQAPFWVAGATGKTVFEAASNLLLLSPRPMFLGHTRVLALGEAYARGGIAGALDMFDRERQTRRNVLVAVVQGAAGQEVLEAQFVLEAGGQGLFRLMLTGARTTALAPEMQLNEFLIDLATAGIDPLAGRLEVIRGPGPGQAAGVLPEVRVRYSGAALFRDDRLVGWLGPHEARGVLWVRNKAPMGVIRTPCPGEPGRFLTLQFYRSSGRIRAQPRPAGLPRFRVDVRAEGNLQDVECARGEGGVSEPDARRGLEEVVRNEVRTALERSRALGVDPFGFGLALSRSHPREFERWQEDWRRVYPLLEVDVHTVVWVRRSSLTTDRIRPRRREVLVVAALVVLVMLAMAALDVPGLVRTRRFGEIVAYGVLWATGLVLGVLQALAVPWPNPTEYVVDLSRFLVRLLGIVPGPGS